MLASLGLETGPVSREGGAHPCAGRGLDYNWCHRRERMRRRSAPEGSGEMPVQDEASKTAQALAAMRESWRRSEAAGLARMTMDEIEAELAAAGK